MYKNLSFTHLAAIALAATLTLPLTAAAQNPPPTQAKPDKVQDTTAVQQKENPADLAITQNIHKAIMADKSLSPSAQDVKIVTVNGAVTLTGSVASEDEKKRVEELANGVLKGSGSLTNSITVKA